MKKNIFDVFGIFLGIFAVTAIGFFLIGRSVGIDKMAVEGYMDTEVLEENEIIDLNPAESYDYYFIDSQDEFERDMVEKLVNALGNSKGDIRYEKNAAGKETIIIHLSWDNRD